MKISNSLTVTGIISLTLAFASGCGLEDKAKNEKKENLANTFVNSGEAQQQEKGSIEFDLSNISLDKAEVKHTPTPPPPVQVPGNAPTTEPVFTAKLVLYYEQECLPDTALAKAKPGDAAQTSTKKPDYRDVSPTPSCFNGRTTVDLSKTKGFKIESIPAGVYSFYAVLHDRNGRKFKTGSASINVVGGQVNNGTIVLQRVVSGNGSVVVDFIDADGPEIGTSCWEYNNFRNLNAPERCQSGNFTCSYGKLTETTACGEYGAKEKILKALCAEKLPYDPKLLKCSNKK